MKKCFPIITVCLIGINIIVFIVSAITGDLLYNRGAFYSDVFMQRKEWYRTITAMFLHADLMHLTSNMILLYLAGELVERYCGTCRYLILYFVTGIFGNMFSGIIDCFSGTRTSSVGASGAVFGLIGALLLLVTFDKDEYKDITLGRLVFMIVYMLYAGFTTEGVNNAAHIGGLIMGVFSMLLLCHSIIFRKRKVREDILIE